jgi:hypothetical protein
MEIRELQRKMGEERQKLKAQQALYESVRADRNQFSQQYVEVQDEISEMKKKFKIITHQIEQLKDEIQRKDEVLFLDGFIYFFDDGDVFFGG